MITYSEKLIREFKEANGVRAKDTNSNSFKEDFNYWLKQREKAKEDYLILLKNLKINYDAINTIEVGKGEIDSLVYNLKTTVISTYYVDETKRRGLTLIGEPIIIGDKMKYKSQDIILSIPITWEKTFMTQNVSDLSELNKWQNLTKDNIVVVGAYGKTSDLDMTKKIRELKKFARKLDDYIYDCGDVNDTYTYAIISKKLKIKK